MLIVFQEGAAQGAGGRAGGRPQAVPAGSAAGAQAARARHAPACRPAARPRLQRVASLAQSVLLPTVGQGQIHFYNHLTAFLSWLPILT